ncbi:MAG: hypothetical protein Q4C51_01535 [Clostridia bacterium]|nr:hypothetical protein [Clostridia bacterium]
MFWIIMKWIIVIDVALFLLWAAFSFLNNVGESLCKVGDFFGKITPKTAKASTQAKSATETKPAEPEALAKYDPYAFKTFNDPMPPEEDIEWGNDAWWDVQKRYIDESLYVNHDWDIFKDDK